MADVRIRTNQQGFSVIELLAVAAIVAIISLMAAPSAFRVVGDMELHGDARTIHNMIGVAKMSAASRFTRSRFYVDLTTRTLQMQYWDKTAATWTNDGGTTTLSDGVDFGMAGTTAPPPSTQAALAQAPACLTDAGLAIANTACVVFSSRGIPIDSIGNPDGNTAFYITDNETGVYGVTLSATPLVRLWWSPATHTAWMHK